MFRSIVILLATAALTVACSGPAPTSAEQAHAIEGQVWSPYCPGRLLIDCTTQQARDLRTEIADRIDAGQPPDEVLAWIEDDFGSQAIARPGGGAGGLAIWLIPLGIFLAGGLVVAAKVRRWTREGRDVQAGRSAHTTGGRHADP